MISFTGIFLKILQNYPKLSLTIYLFWGIWGYLRYLTGRGNVRCGMHLVREISVGHLPGRGNVRWAFVWLGKCPLGICLVGEVSIGDVSGRGSVRPGRVRRGWVRESSHLLYIFLSQWFSYALCLLGFHHTMF